MAQIDRLDIEYSRPEKSIYHAGEVLVGEVIIELSKELHLEEIELAFLGVSKVMLRKALSDECNKEVLNSRSPIFPEFTHTKGKCVIPRGKQTAHFRFPLPDDLPGSFLTERGSTTYFTECLLHMKKGHEGESVKKPFTLIENVDLNFVVKNKATEIQRSLVISKCCGRPETVDVCLALNRPGYIPGEPIAITGEIINNSVSQIKKAFVSLIQVISYYGYGHVAEWEREIARSTSNLSLKLGQTVEVEDEIIVPNTEPSTQVRDAIIDIQYILKLSINPLSPTVPLNITIGSKALIDTPASGLPQEQRFVDDVPEVEVPNRFALLNIQPSKDPKAGKKPGRFFSLKSNMMIRTRCPQD